LTVYFSLMIKASLFSIFMTFLVSAGSVTLRLMVPKSMGSELIKQEDSRSTRKHSLPLTTPHGLSSIEKTLTRTTLVCCPRALSVSHLSTTSARMMSKKLYTSLTLQRPGPSASAPPMAGITLDLQLAHNGFGKALRDATECSSTLEIPMPQYLLPAHECGSTR